MTSHCIAIDNLTGDELREKFHSIFKMLFYMQVWLFFKLIVMGSDSRIVNTVSGTYLFKFMCAFSGKIVKIFPKLFSKLFSNV